tara:strand:+ start:391 stop:519 length:129 start_codon:yes stop_codon:yes gene_type:complete
MGQTEPEECSQEIEAVTFYLQHCIELDMRIKQKQSVEKMDWF